jgi:hypothetical protein
MVLTRYMATGQAPLIGLFYPNDQCDEPSLPALFKAQLAQAGVKKGGRAPGRAAAIVKRLFN